MKNTKAYRDKKYIEACDIVAKEGYKMLSDEWTGYRSYYILQCPNEHKYTVQWAEFKRGTRCRKCHSQSLMIKNPSFKGKTREEHRREMTKLFTSELTSEGYMYGDDFKYINSSTKIPVKCMNQHDWEVSWNTWTSGKRCRDCFIERTRKSNEEIKLELELEGCQLIGQYYGADKPFKYICSCGNKSTIRIGDFRRGVRCSRCVGDRTKESRRQKRMEELRLFDFNEKTPPSR
jgi:hypothetical protein